MDFADVVRHRRMTREFLREPVDPAVFRRCVDLASRAPSAGKAQGWSLVVLENDHTRVYWDVALPADKRRSFAFPGLLNAPILAVVCADRGAYLARYSEPDKSHTQLGGDASRWPAPYWVIDAAFATMTLLLALEDAGLGALFFAHASEPALRRELSIPDDIDILGVVAVGHPDPTATRAGRSSQRSRLGVDDIIRHARW